MVVLARGQGPEQPQSSWRLNQQGAVMLGVGVSCADMAFGGRRRAVVRVVVSNFKPSDGGCCRQVAAPAYRVVGVITA